MTNIETHRDPHGIDTHISIFTNEERSQIRDKLKKAVGYSDESRVPENDISQYKPEVHHEEAVPFEGTVHGNTGCKLNSKEIDKKYRQSLPSLWWIITQSILATALRVMNRFRKLYKSFAS